VTILLKKEKDWNVTQISNYFDGIPCTGIDLLKRIDETSWEGMIKFPISTTPCLVYSDVFVTILEFFDKDGKKRILEIWRDEDHWNEFTK
jgi:hypothetical protein